MSDLKRLFLLTLKRSDKNLNKSTRKDGTIACLSGAFVWKCVQLKSPSVGLKDKFKFIQKPKSPCVKGEIEARGFSIESGVFNRGIVGLSKKQSPCIAGWSQNS